MKLELKIPDIHIYVHIEQPTATDVFAAQIEELTKQLAASRQGVQEAIKEGEQALKDA